MVGSRKRFDQAARRQRRLHLQHQILGLAVLGRQHPRSASGEEATQGRSEMERAGIVGHRQTDGVQLLLQSRAVDSSFRGDDQARVVDLQDSVHPGEVQCDPPVRGERSPLGSRPSAPWDHGHTEITGDANARGDFLRVCGVNGDIGGGVGQVLVAHVLAHPRPVISLGFKILGIDRHVVRSDGIGQLSSDEADHIPTANIAFRGSVQVLHYVSLSVYRSRY